MFFSFAEVGIAGATDAATARRAAAVRTAPPFDRDRKIHLPAALPPALHQSSFFGDPFFR